jgi:hypothetical protein
VEIKKKYIKQKKFDRVQQRKNHDVRAKNDNKKICYEKYEREREKNFFHSKQTSIYMSIVKNKTT